MNLDTIYNDFTTQLLPKIQEGLVITKDYFMDFASRYIQYLIVQDSLIIILNIIVLIVSIYGLYKIGQYIKNYNDDNGEGYDAIMIIVGIISIFTFIQSGINIFINSQNLVKDLYIPEVRLYEEFKSYTKGNE